MNFRCTPSLNWLIKVPSKQFELKIVNQDLILVTNNKNKLLRELESPKTFYQCMKSLLSLNGFTKQGKIQHFII